MTLSTKKQPVYWQFQRYWELLYVLVERNLKRRYRGSILGVYWSLLNPLILTGIYTAIFGTIFARYYQNSIINYALAAFTGLAVINFFTSSTTQALESLVKNGDLINKIKLPLAIFPLSTIGANIFQLCVGMLPLLAIVTLIITKNIFNIFLLFLPLSALVLVCAGVGFLVSALYIFFRDLPYFYELVIFAVTLTSPIFYPSAIVPAPVKKILFLNPLFPIVESIRQISLLGQVPELITIVQAWLGGVLILTFGWLCFRWWQHQFIDLL
jgi:ABC-2 type transport system permease protein/lipopolysaccharide transport system permease protein